MEDTMRRIVIMMSEEEIEALKKSASENLRDPRDHARFLLRRALGLYKTEDTGDRLAAAPVSSQTS